MESMDRRDFLSLSAAAAGAALRCPARASGAEVPDRSSSRAILYDATRCIGCRACARTCRVVQGLAAARGEIDGVEFDMPRDLSAEDLMVIQAYRSEPEPDTGESSWSFMKKNCMHCNEPACVSACPVAALEKTEDGPVVYYESKCMGCRYCMLACPYGVPRYEWRDRMPRVRKCDMNGACVAACPVEALVAGTRQQLLDEAHRRIDADPDRYVPRVYGEHEAGGTSYLFLSGIPFERFGLPNLPPPARATYADTLMAGLPGWIIGLGLFLGGLYQVQRRQAGAETKTEEQS